MTTTTNRNNIETIRGVKFSIRKANGLYLVFNELSEKDEKLFCNILTQSIEGVYYLDDRGNPDRRENFVTPMVDAYDINDKSYSVNASYVTRQEIIDLYKINRITNNLVLSYSDDLLNGKEDVLDELEKRVDDYRIKKVDLAKKLLGRIAEIEKQITLIYVAEQIAFHFWKTVVKNIRFGRYYIHLRDSILRFK